MCSYTTQAADSGMWLAAAYDGMNTTSSNIGRDWQRFDKDDTQFFTRRQLSQNKKEHCQMLNLTD